MSLKDEASHILIVDDDRRIRELLKSYLTSNGYRVTAAAQADEARKAMMSFAFDLLIVDVMMPGESGLSLTRSLRETNDVPILILSALAESSDRIEGLSSGGDDYISKPFEPQELLLRIANILRRKTKVAAPIQDIMMGSCSFNLQRGELRRDGQTVKLTSRERDLLRLFAERRGEAISRNELAGENSSESVRAVDVQINRLRRKIEADPATPVYLQTVRGSGYILYTD
ncbi:two-component system phosphate regulon response regulator OmpR [Rhodoligotrophos appendicifer]|uniref:response regulator n=1 Tax=Rhodoligotrophos appendicifer TaxID=987056 RepID=UPI001184F8B2|nr:response regulator transcription factor [Rhodoligotrophos appendicifer]